jgi:DNA-directed RNA polymerase specialized sigma subunit
VSRARDKALDEYMPMIRMIAARLASRYPSDVTMDDLIKAGAKGLKAVLKKHEPDEPMFKKNVEFYVRGSMLKLLRPKLTIIPNSQDHKNEPKE